MGSALLGVVTFSLVSCIHGFDFYIFQQQWPFGQNRSACVDGFTIHGLWPNYKNGTWPQNCKGATPYNGNKIGTLLPRLLCDWPSDSQGNGKFWSHEWDKHGTCAQVGDPTRITSEKDYFQSTLDLYDKFNLTSAAVECGLTNRWNQAGTIKKDCFLGNLKKMIQHEPILGCQAEAKFNDNTLKSVSLCVSKAFEMIDCPPEVVSKTTQGDGCYTNSFQELYFPQLPHVTS